jgi:hypothetical protein
METPLIRYSQLLTVGRQAGVGKHTVRKLLLSGVIPAVQLPGCQQKLYRRDDAVRAFQTKSK